MDPLPVGGPAKEVHVVIPRDGDDYAEPARGALIKEPFRRNLIETQDIGSPIPHVVEVAGSNIRGRQAVIPPHRTEGAVGRPMQKKLGLAYPKKLAAGGEAGQGGIRIGNS